MYDINKIKKLENEVKKMLTENNLIVENESSYLHFYDKDTFKKASAIADATIKEKIDLYKNSILDLFLDYLKIKYNIEPTNIFRSDLKKDNITSVSLDLKLFDPYFDYDLYYFNDWEIPLDKEDKDIIFYIEYDKIIVYLLNDNYLPLDGYILKKDLFTFKDIDNFISNIKDLLKLNNLCDYIK